MAKAKKKSKAKKSKTKPAKKKAKKIVKRAAAKAKKAPVKSKKTARKAAKKAKKTTAKVKKAAPAPKKKQLVGEGDYAASRKFLKEQAGFVERNKDKIPAMGKAAEAALDGPEGDSLRAAEQEAMNRSTME